MRTLTRTALTLTVSVAVLLSTAVISNASTRHSIDPQLAHNHGHPTTVFQRIKISAPVAAQPEAPKAASNENATLPRAGEKHRKGASRVHNHAPAPVYFQESCMVKCMRPLIPDELLIACAVVCAGGVVPACALCLGWYSGVAIGCAIECGLLTSENRAQPTKGKDSPSPSRNTRKVKQVVNSVT